MSYGDGRYWIVFNGEIYNYRELKSTLALLGHRFKTDSDTEVIIACYAEWGGDAPGRLRGIFAFAIWDTHERRLLLARDHLGVKPLLYAIRGTSLAFSSELKGLLGAGVGGRPCPEAVSDYLALGYTLGTKTMVADVCRLEPASTLEWRDGRVTVKRFWDAAQFAQGSSAVRPDASWIEEYSARLDAAVNLQMVSDVPVGAFLSGGVDSSSIAYWMGQHTPHRVRTFSMGFDEPSFSELPYANRAAEALGT